MCFCFHRSCTRLGIVWDFSGSLRFLLLDSFGFWEDLDFSGRRMRSDVFILILL